MSIKLGVVMDPMATIKPYKDSTLAMLLAAQTRQISLYYMEAKHLFVRDGVACATQFPLTVADDNQSWFALGQGREAPLSDLDIVLMRVDPPFNMNYIFMTYQLELAQQAGTLVVNHPQSLRDINEKFAITHFPQFCPATLISGDITCLKAFVQAQGEAVVKPLDSMGGDSIFRVNSTDTNLNVILETITHNQARPVMAQRYIAEVMEQGDKRILLIGGQPYPYGLARYPQSGDFRGNLAVGGKGKVEALTAKEYEICAAIGPILRQKGVHFAGIDTIGGYLTEINITSPTCIREISAVSGEDVAGQLIDYLLTEVAVKPRSGN